MKRKYIEQDLFDIYQRIGINKPVNHDEILDFCFEDVDESGDKDNWHSGDVAISFRRWIESKTEV